MKIFISSTFLDLEDHRAEVIKALRTSGDDPIDMETFGARSSVATDVCYREIDKCDVFVGIYAHRYGHCPGGSRKSITEMEFDYATEKGKDRLVFLVDEDVAWLPKLVDGAEPKRRLSAFKERLSKRLVIGKFSTPDSLATLVVASLSRVRGEKPTRKQQSLETLRDAIRDSKKWAQRGRVAGWTLIPVAPIAASLAPKAVAEVAPVLEQNLILIILCWSAMWAYAAWILPQARDCINGCQVTEAYLEQKKCTQAGRQASLTTCIRHLREVIAEASRQGDPKTPAADSTPQLVPDHD